MDDLAFFEQILAAVVLALNTDRPADVPLVTTRRVFPSERITEPTMGVFLGDEQLDAPRAGSNRDPIARRRIAIAVQCIDATDDKDELDSIVSPMLQWSTKVLGLQRLGGLVHYIRETGTTRTPVYQDLFTMTATQVFECSYQTRRDDLTVRL